MTKRTWHKLPKLARRLLVVLLILAIVTPFYLFIFNRSASAAWFDENWAYRQAIPVTSTNGSAQANVFVSFTLDTATLITAGKLQSSCQDLRITDVGGKLLKYHIARVTACNNAATTVDFLLASFPDGKSTYYVYYGNPSAPSADAGSLTVSQASSAAVTASGNEITDAKRTTNTEGDGVTPPDSSYGIWPAATNLVTNGGFETNTTGYSAQLSATLTRITSDFKFGTASLQIVTPGSAGNEGWAMSSNVSASTQYTASVWLKGSGTVRLDTTDNGGGTQGTLNNITLTSTWTRYTLTTTTGGTATFLTFYLRTNSTQGVTFYSDGVQVETGSIATPYIETNGGTAQRLASRIQAPSSVLNPTQGWAAFRVRMGFPSTSTVTKSWFSWVTDTNNRVYAQWDGSNRKWYSERLGGGTWGGAASAADTFAVGDMRTVVFTWEAATLKVSVNGAAFVSTAQTSIPSMTATQIDIGSYIGTVQHAASDVLWTAMGTGTLTDADAATIGHPSTGYGNTDPTSTQLSTLNGGVAIPTFLWTADTTADTQTTYSQSHALNYTIGSLATEEKSPGPIAYWKFDEGTGATAKDSTTNANNGTLGGTTVPTWQLESQCVTGKCLYFDGSTSKVTASKAALNVQTVSFWVRPNTIATQGLVSMNDASSRTIATNGSGVISATNFTSPTYYINGVSTTTPTLVQNKWNFVEVTTATGVNSGTAATIGTDGTNFIKGFIDDVKFYNYARTAAQVKADYAARGTSKGVSAKFGHPELVSGSNLSNGLVGYWKMDESSWTNDCSTTSVTDSSGNSNNGKACPATTGPTGGAVGKFGNGGSFDGGDDYVLLADSTALKPTSAVSISAWVNPTNFTCTGADTNCQIYAKYGGNFYGYHLFTTSAGIPRINICNGSSCVNAISSIALTAATWSLVTAVWDGSKVYIYVNGVQTGSASASTLAQDTTAPTIGKASWYSGNYWNGKIDEARIYNRALSGAEVSALYNFAPGPVGYWNFEEKTGTTANDTSGNANTGTVSGASWSAGKFGASLNYDGTDDVTTVTNATAIDLNTAGAHTFSAWVYADTAGEGSGGQVYQKGATTYLRVDTLSGSNLDVEASLDLATTDATLNISAPITTGTWNHIAVTYEDDADDEITIYINGVNKGSSTNGVGSIAADANNLLIGGTTTDNFDGKIDDFRMYNYARTAKQIVSDMNAGHPIGGSPVGSQLAYYKFDEGYSNIVHDIGSFATNGTTTGASWSNAGKFGKALSFTDAQAHYVSFGTVTLPSMSQLTVSGWYKWAGSSNTSIQALEYWPANNGIALSPNRASADNTMTFLTKNGGSDQVFSSAKVPLDTNSWTYVAFAASVSGDGTSITVKGYKNGVLYAQQTISGLTSASFGGLSAGYNLGSTYTTRAYSGLMDEVKMYSSALTADEVKVDMNQGKSQVMGALGDNSTYAINAANQEYCIPGDTTSCAAPVGRWDFEEGSGTSAQDSSGGGSTGTITGATFKPGKQGKALNFNGSTDTASVSNSLSTQTVGFWVNPTTTTQNLIDLRTAATAANISVSSGTISATGFTSPTIYVNGAVSSTLAANSWQYVTITTGTAIAANAIAFGRISSTSLTGKLDSIRFYDYARSAAQIAWDYNRGAPVGWWKMDECQGSTANDSSGNGNSGTITIGATGSQTTTGTCLTPTDGTGAWYNGATGKYNASLSFDGTDDKITTSAFSPLATAAATTTKIAWGGWFYPTTSAASKTLIEKATEFQLTTDASSMPICGVYYSGAFHNSSAPTQGLTLSAWNHVLCTYDGTNINTYLNGNLIKQSAETTAVTAASSILYFAETSGGANFYSGQMDDARIYNYALTAAQVKLLYNQNSAIRFGPTTGSP